MPLQSRQPEYVCEQLNRCGVTANNVSQKEAWAYERAWLQSYAQQVKAQKGKWVLDGFRWHGFSFGLVPCRDSDKAIDAYLSQWPSETIVFNEQLTFCLRCDSAKPSRTILESLGNHDYYICHHNMKWTMVLTHEAGWLGPYFSSKTLLGLD